MTCLVRVRLLLVSPTTSETVSGSGPYRVSGLVGGGSVDGDAMDALDSALRNDRDGHGRLLPLIPLAQYPTAQTHKVVDGVTGLARLHQGTVRRWSGKVARNDDGAIGNYFNDFGQCQESGRDQGHTQMGLEYLANTCETAWSQGVDLNGALDNRLLLGFEYTAKYNLGHDGPYEPFESF